MAALENDYLDLEEKIKAKACAACDEAIDSVRRATKAGEAVGAWFEKHSDDQECKGGRKHGLEVRASISRALVIGLSPRQVIPMLEMSKIDFGGHVQQIDFVRKMRRELRISVLTLAARAAADPKVRCVPHTFPAVSSVKISNASEFDFPGKVEADDPGRYESQRPRLRNR